MRTNIIIETNTKVKEEEEDEEKRINFIQTTKKKYNDNSMTV